MITTTVILTCTVYMYMSEVTYIAYGAVGARERSVVIVTDIQQ